MQTESRARLKLLIPLGILLVLIAAFLIYTGIYYHADETAQKALQSDASVQISKADYGWFFDGPGHGRILL